MKKNIIKLFIGVLATTSLSLSSCIDETFPTSIATDEQLAKSAKATEALMWAMPAFANKLDILNSGSGNEKGYDWGYGSIMHIRDVMTEEMVVTSSTYDWYTSWAGDKSLGESLASTQLIWNYYWKYVLTTNSMIKAVPKDASNMQLGYLSVGYAFRAFLYLDMAQMFEFLPNDKTSSVNTAGNDVLNLTVPIVTDTVTEIVARNNPRVTRQKMFDFILSDLNSAERYIPNLNRSVKTLPDLSVVYGLKARLYMWVGDYANARLYARKAIDTGLYTPTTKENWLNTASGFNTLTESSWMWGTKTQKEDDVVKTGILNWTSWMSNETTYGYAAAGPIKMIDARTYSKISDDDFRKLTWKAPAGSSLDGQNKYVNAAAGASLPAYASLKFRPGQGNATDYNVGSSCAYPFMRIEEMYFIEAEAAAHITPSEGAALFTKFMQTYRYKKYSYKGAVTEEDVVNEIFFNKKVEFWGEGLTFFDYKRLNKQVNRGYTGTNHSDANRFNTTTRPAWMNFCIVLTEKNNNKALVGYENPDPSDKYTAWK